MSTLSLTPAERRQRVLLAALWRVQRALASYLPLLLMALLASGTWWLVKNTPLLGEAADKPAPRHVPDYRMHKFEIQRIGADGRLHVLINGAELRHYPDTDTVEIDELRLRAVAPNGRLAVSEARHGVSNADGSDLQLSGNVVLRVYAAQGAEGTPAQLEVRGEFLQVLGNAELLRSHLPVTVRQGGTTIQAQAIEYRHLSGQLLMKGRTQGRIESRPKR